MSALRENKMHSVCAVLRYVVTDQNLLNRWSPPVASLPASQVIKRPDAASKIAV